MKSRAISPPLLRFLRQQELYIAIAVAVYAIFWAIRSESANAIVTLIYSLFLCNFTVLIQERSRSLYSERRLASFWGIYLAILFLLTPVAVVASTLIVFWVLKPVGISFWPFLESGWKFPSVATVIFGVATQLYRRTKTRLEQRNRELQRSVQSEMAQRELQDQELQRAREIQQELLPKEIPQIAGFDIAGAWEPARIVGGDYFDIIKLSGSKLAVCIADVVGKSVSAALLMANVQATVRAFASESATPSWLCSRVNSVLCSNIATGKFVTLFYGILDAERQTLQYTNAGHSRPILINGSGAAERLDNGGALLGVFPDWKYEDSVVQLAPGDRLLLFTDGITEAAKPDGEEFGEDRLVRVAKAVLDVTPAELNTYLLKDVKNFCNSQLQDDATLIVIAVAAARAAIKPKMAAVSS